MELQDVGRRIFGQYWWLIALYVILGAMVGAASHVGSKQYTASARVVLDTPDPTTRAGSVAIADTVKALATSASQVSAALRAAHISNRDPIDIAEHHVGVTGLGSSAIATISVSDRDRNASAAIANALARRVIQTRRDVTSGGVLQELGGLNARISDLDGKISVADTSQRREFLTQQRAGLESERISILGTYALRPKPAIISRAAAPLHADSSGMMAYLILGGLLGLIVGVAIAGVVETVRPTLVGGYSVARELEVPLLGELREDVDGSNGDVDGASVAARVRLAAETAGVGDVVLLPARKDVDVRRLAARLDAAAATGAADADLLLGGTRDVGSPVRSHPPTGIRPFALLDPTASSNEDAGIVVVAPRRLKKADLLDLRHLLMLTPLPLVGLIEYRPAKVIARRFLARPPKTIAKQPT